MKKTSEVCLEVENGENSHLDLVEVSFGMAGQSRIREAQPVSRYNQSQGPSCPQHLKVTGV